MEFKWIKEEIKNLESVKNSDNNALTPLGIRELKELKLALSICEVSRQLKGLFLKKDKVMYCGYNVIISEICNKKWCIITDENDHHYNARIKDLRPRTF